MALQLYKIATVEVGSAGSSSIAFNSIPQGYTDLKVVYNLRTDYSGAINDGVALSLNGSTASFTTRFLFGNGASAATNTSTSYTGGVTNSSTATANSFGNGELYIPNYTSSGYKSVSTNTVSENNATTALALFASNLWSSTSAITSLSLASSFGTLITQYSTATLYGIL